MALTTGVLSQLAVGATTAKAQSTPATGGTGPYTYQWYVSNVSGFTPGAGNIVAGATSLILDISTLVPNSQYYAKVVSTDTGNGNITVTSLQLPFATSAVAQNVTSFQMSPTLGQVDLLLNPNTVSVQIDASQSTPLRAGCPVKIVDSAGGVPKVVGCSANSDEVVGFINYDVKSQSFPANAMAEISMSGNCIYLYATGAIARGARVQLDLITAPFGGVKTITGSSGAKLVGWAYDKATAGGQLIRVILETPSFAVA